MEPIALTPSGKVVELERFYWVVIWRRVGGWTTPEVAECWGREWAFCGTDVTGHDEVRVVSEALEAPSWR